IDGGQIDDRADASAVQIRHLPLGDVEDPVAVPQVGPVLLDSGRTRDDVLVHQGGPELCGGDRAQRGLDGRHGGLLHRVHTSSTGLSAPGAASTTDAIAGSRSRRSAVSRAGSRLDRSSALLIRTTTRARSGTFFRPPSGRVRTPATISGVTVAPAAAPLSALTRSGRWTCAASRRAPKTSAPTTGTTTVVSGGITG